MFGETIFGRLLRAFLLIIMVCALAFGVLGGYYARNLYIQRVRGEAKREAILIGELIRAHCGGDAAAIDTACAAAAQKTGSRITVIAENGTVLGDTEHDRTSMDSHNDRPEVKQARRDGAGHSSRYSSTLKTEMMYTAILVESPSGGELVVRIARPLSGIYAELNMIYLRMGLSALVLVILAVILAAMLSAGFSAPLREISHRVAQFAKGDLDKRLPPLSISELESLATSFNSMADQVRERIDQVVESRNLREAILGGMIEGVVAVDPGGHLIMANRSARKMFSLNDDFEGKLAHGLIRSPATHDFIDELLSKRGELEREIELEADGGKFSAHGAMITNRSGGNIGAVIVFNDVTRLRRLERIRQDFVANVSHEIKTPLTAIKGAAETMRDGAMKDKKAAKTFLTIIVKNADRLHKLVADILDLSQLESGLNRSELDFQRHNVIDALKTAREACSPKAAGCGVEIILTCDTRLRADYDRHLFEQALINLFDNAVKYSNGSKRVEVEARRVDDKLRISVRDYGVGIPTGDQERIFERFYRVDKARSRELGGTGLGLSIVKHIAVSHGGTVSLESEISQGSTFYIEIPLLRDRGISPSPTRNAPSA